jgi:membrane protease YdiL (CAAX protease family)
MLFGSIAALANLLLMLAGGTDDGSAGIASTALKLDVTGLAAVTHIVFLAPIAEEAAFRGIIYRLFRRSMLPLGAITVSAIIFAVMHVQPATALWALFLGIGAGVCYEQTRSLLAPILVHALFNAVPVGVAVIRTMPEDLGPLWLILAVAAIVFSFSAASAGRIAD